MDSKIFANKIRYKFASISNKFFWKHLGLKVDLDTPLVYLHKYKDYQEYRDTQVAFNRQKLNKVWADESTIKLICNDIASNSKTSSINSSVGLCHGSRNGWEVKMFRQFLGSDNIIGTDISDTAETFPFMVRWDFHDKNSHWIEHHDFVYTNSLDQSWKPLDALTSWFQQLKLGGTLYIEHSRAHGPRHASRMDPFGIEPEFFPYFLVDSFGDKISMRTMNSIKSNYNNQVWIFAITRLK